MNEREYNRAVGKILAGIALDHDEAQYFVQVLFDFEEMLDEGDSDDYFGSEGWRHRMGWD